VLQGVEKVPKVHALEEKPATEVQDEAEKGPSPIIYLKQLRSDVEKLREYTKVVIPIEIILTVHVDMRSHSPRDS